MDASGRGGPGPGQRRYQDFIGAKIYDLLLIGQAAARANLRDVIEPWDLPVTKGLQESIHDFGEVDEEIELQPLLDDLVAPHRSTWPSATRPRPGSRPSRVA